ncbi:hypothetical protein PGB90_003730 [Kerria lacca]
MLLSFIDIINETIGDAVSDFLALEIILHYKGWSLANWNKLYKDLPYRMLKVTVKDRNVITTTDAERKCVLPSDLQPAIDDLIKKYKNGRAFVRPSGTEDLIRVYAEAATQTEADELALKVSQLVYDTAGGVNDRPT